MNKKGMTTVFVTIVAGSVISLVICFVTLACREAAVSYSESVMNLAGRSVLAEFDRDLKKRYGLIAFYGQKDEIEEKILDYSSYALDKRQYVRIGDIEADLKDFSLGDRSVFENEIKEYTEYYLPLLALDRKERGPVTTGKRVLRNSEILSQMPSNAFEDISDSTDIIGTIKNLSSISDLFRAGTMKYYSNLYIFSKFYSGQSTDYKDDSFFRNEVEYIIAGENSDDENLSEIRKKIISIRTALNLIYLQNDSGKQAAALAAAQLITPGPEAEITKTFLIVSWAAAEAQNDWKLLIEGRNVPVYKDDGSWATDISYVTDQVADRAYPESEAGFCYDEYLMILLYSIKDEVKYARMMDLIEINMKGTCRAGMKLKDMYRGFSFSVQINGRKHEYMEKY